MNQLRLAVLGPFEASRDNRPLESFRTSKVKALLVYLLVGASDGWEGGVPREKVMTLLWPELPEKSAQRNLRQALYHLRRTIPDVAGPNGEAVPFVLADRNVIRVNPAAQYELDLATFQTLLQSRVDTDLTTAVRLYRGDFLADFYLADSSEFEAWASGWRSRLRRQALDALDLLARQERERGQPSMAARYARQALAIDQLHEPAEQELIWALGAMGKRAAALQQYEHHRTLLMTELGVEPAGKTESIAAEVRQQPASHRARLPVLSEPLIGRETELTELTTLLQNDARLVTIVGPGGMGKTHLALSLAHQLTTTDANAGGFFDQAVYVDMAPLSTAEELLPDLARALNLVFDRGDRHVLQARVLAALEGKDLLLLFDNFEHLPEAVSLLVEIMDAAPAVRLLVTSRERLNLRAEHVYPLTGLAYTAWTTPVEAAGDAAGQLFLGHARRVNPSFSLTSEQMPSLEGLMRITGGMPLALILAASWVRVLGLDEIVSEIGTNAGFLGATFHDLPPRQSSMQAVFETSWQRLTPREQRVLSSLAVFRGGFTLAAAQHVGGATTHDMLRFVDHTLVERTSNGRFRIHELMRQFGWSRCTASGAADDVQTAHSSYYLHWLATLLPRLKGAEQLNALQQIDNEFHNVSIAWQYGCKNALWSAISEASQSLYLYFLIRSRYHEGIDLFRLARSGSEALRTEPETSARALATAIQYALIRETGANDEAQSLLSEGESLAEALHDPLTQAFCRLLLAKKAVGLPPEVTRAHLAGPMAAFEAAGDKHLLAYAYYEMGWTYFSEGQVEATMRSLHHGLHLAQQQRDYFVRAELHRLIGNYMWTNDGLTEESVRHYHEAVDLQRAMGAWVPYALTLAQVANLPVWMSGDLSSARPLLDEALAIANEQKVDRVIGHVLAEMTTCHLMEGRYEESLELTTRVRALTSEFSETHTWATYQRGIALLGLGEADPAAGYMQQALVMMIAQDWSGLARPLMSFAGCVLAEWGELERAVELLAHSFSDPYTSGRATADPLVAHYLTSVREELDAERFSAAWQRGERLDTLEAMVATLDLLQARTNGQSPPS